MAENYDEKRTLNAMSRLIEARIAFAQKVEDAGIKAVEEAFGIIEDVLQNASPRSDDFTRNYGPAYIGGGCTRGVSVPL